MILGLGVDIIEIDRIQKAMERPGFAARILSERERAYWTQKGCSPATLAGAFAAKEAVAKALGTGIGHIGWTDIEILHNGQGQPYAVLLGPAEERLASLGASRVHLSISHGREQAIAQVILEK